jgi:hypothetical protein
MIPLRQKRSFSPGQLLTPERTLGALPGSAGGAAGHDARCFINSLVRPLASAAAAASLMHVLTYRPYSRLVHRWVDSIGLESISYGTHSIRQTKAT